MFVLTPYPPGPEPGWSNAVASRVEPTAQPLELASSPAPAPAPPPEVTPPAPPPDIEPPLFSS